MSNGQEFTAKLDEWASATRARINLVVAMSATKLIAAAQTEVNQGGRMPVDTGTLRRSLRSSLYGNTAMIVQDGAESYILVAGSMEAGDVAVFDWRAEYAPHVEYGTRVWTAAGRPGYHFAGAAAARWQEFIDASTAEAKSRIGGAG